MIDFYNTASWADTCSPDEIDDVRADHNKRIKSDLENIGSNKFSLGSHLIDLYSSHAYAWNIQKKKKWSYIEEKGYYDYVDQDGFWGDVRACRFFDYCEETFGLDKSQVSRYMNIVDEFGDQLIGFKKEWREYSYSQLVELLPLTPEQRKEVKPDWSVKRIREYKRSLVATSQQSKSDENKQAKLRDQFCGEFVSIPSSDGTFNYTKYDRFRCCTLKYLLDRYIGIESELEEKTRQLSEMKNAAAASSVVPAELNILSEAAQNDG